MNESEASREFRERSNAPGLKPNLAWLVVRHLASYRY